MANNVYCIVCTIYGGSNPFIVYLSVINDIRNESLFYIKLLHINYNTMPQDFFTLKLYLFAVKFDI